MKPKIKVVWVLGKNDGFVWEVYKTKREAMLSLSLWHTVEDGLVVRRVEVKHG